MPEKTLNELAMEFATHSAAIVKKLICCAPDEKLRQLLDDAMPTLERLVKLITTPQDG